MMDMRTNPFQKAKWAVSAVLLATATFLAAPASAFCIKNQTSRTLIVKLETPNPLGKFHTQIGEGKEICCDWFNRRCNPTGAREELLQFSVRERSRTVSRMFCDNAPGRRVWGIGIGTITITESPFFRGGLKCDSRDFYQREVKPSMRSKKGIAPPPIVAPPVRSIPTIPSPSP